MASNRRYRNLPSQEATAAFVGVFDQYSVADMIEWKDVFRAFFAAA
jgi:Rrf2 family nitric oxide-sensitive transcriptional repressor